MPHIGMSIGVRAHMQRTTPKKRIFTYVKQCCHAICWKTLILARTPALQVISVITLATGLELSNDLLNPILISPDPHLARQSTALSNPLGFHMVPPSGWKEVGWMDCCRTGVIGYELLWTCLCLSAEGPRALAWLYDSTGSASQRTLSDLLYLHCRPVICGALFLCV